MRRLLLALLVFALALFLTGCGDDNLFEGVADDSSTEAKLDEGLEAINDGDYAKAVSILKEVYEDNPNDPDVQKYYASALAGDAGVDTLTLMADIGDAQESTDGDSTIYNSTLTTLFEGYTPGDVLPADQLTDKITSLDSAVDALAPGGTPSAETEFQAGFYSAIKAVLEIEEMIDGVDPGTLTDGVIQNSVTIDDDFGGLYNSLSLVAITQESLVENLAADENSEIGNDFEDYLVDLGFYQYNSTTMEYDTVDKDAFGETQIENYLKL